MNRIKEKNKFLSLLILIPLFSCGGGGSSNPNTPEPNPPNSSDLVCSDYQANTKKCNFTYAGIYREYFIYVPPSYSASSNSPLMFVFHGYGRSATNIMYYSDFQDLADQDSFILVYPQGSLLNGVTHWNVGGWTVGSTSNDIDFTETLIEIVSDDYYINTNRIYSTGMSNGGYMSFHLACNTNKFAAIASVTGSMTPETYDACDPSYPTSIMQIHGLADSTVPYNGATWTRSIPDVMEYWANFNSCDNDPLSVITDLADGSYIQSDSYENCSNDVGVELILHSSMGHTWPGTNGYSLSATSEIWSFFGSYDINGKIN